MLNTSMILKAAIPENFEDLLHLIATRYANLKYLSVLMVDEKEKIMDGSEGYTFKILHFECTRPRKKYQAPLQS